MEPAKNKTPEFSDLPDAALIQILGEKDPLRASLAIQQLSRRPNVVQLIGDRQETVNPMLRRRIHQLSSFVQRESQRKYLLKNLADPGWTHWDVQCQINTCLDAQTSLVHLHNGLMEMLPENSTRFQRTEHCVKYLRELNLSTKQGLNRCLTYYLPSDVLLSASGSSLILAAIAERISQSCGWNSKVGFLKGRKVVLRDESFNVMDPERDWAVTHPPLEDFRVAGKWELAVRLLVEISYASALEQIHSVTYNAACLLKLLLENGPDAKAESADGK